MEIFNNYAGASIDIISINKEENKAILSLRKEKDKYSKYFNFVVKNNKNDIAKIIINNTSNTSYNSKVIPFIKVKNQYKKIENKYIKYNEDNIEIIISPNTTVEVSSYPKYTLEDLHAYLLKIKKLYFDYNEDKVPKITINNNVKKDIVIMARQHPGETLSSFFVEGLMDYIVKYRSILPYNFIIYPFVNLDGVEKGNHRYSNGYDYNRLWFKNGILLAEDTIKSELEKYNLELFIDVHCDEISNFDYLRVSPNNTFKSIDFVTLDDYSKVKRIIRGLVKEQKLIDVRNASAREFVYKKYKCPSILVELSLLNNDQNSAYKKGYDFFKKVVKEE